MYTSLPRPGVGTRQTVVDDVAYRSLHRSGLTLVELVMAVVVLGIAATPLLAAFTSNASAAVRQERHTIAGFLVLEKLEEIVADRHATGRGYDYLASGNYAAESSISGYAGFQRSVTILEVSASDFSTASPGSGYKKITVSVTETALSDTISMSCVFADLD